MQLTSVLQALVHNRGHKLFVGVDEYDAPANQILFGNNLTFYSCLSLFFKSQFFAIIKRNDEVIEKYWVTGVLPVFCDDVSPLNAATLISHWAQYHGVCGLTDNEVQTIAREYLSLYSLNVDVDMVLSELRRWYSGHLFCCNVNHPPLDTLYSPDLVFTFLRALRGKARINPIDEVYDVQSSKILDAIPDGSKAPFIDTFYRAQSGHLKSEVVHSFGVAEASQVGISSRITQTLLYHFGVFTFAADGRHLRIPNTTMISVVSTAFP
jgi:hypothetical protein